MVRRKLLLTAAAGFFLWASSLFGQQEVRVASYNIKFLSTGVTQQGDRLAKLKQVIDLLDAQVIGLQEIDSRDALRLVFPTSQWHLIIDDDSPEKQDLAIVVKKVLSVKGFSGNNPDADDEHFLFPAAGSDDFFPKRRDVLAVEIGFPNSEESFFVMVHHAKSRLEGRATTDLRREGAAKELVKALEQRFDEKNFILLGDFNDNPDDKSLNILETGDPNALAGQEETDGPFLMNLMEPLCAAGHVSHGRNSANIENGTVNTIDVLSRDTNNQLRGTNLNTGDILFDQILIPVRMAPNYVQNSAGVFNNAVAVKGNAQTRASDHLPVFAEFVFGAEPNGGGLAAVRISALLPNPAGEDNSREVVALRNDGSGPVDLAGWKLRDKAGNEYLLQGTIAGGSESRITMTSFSMPLNNGGDEVTLLDAQGASRHKVTYSAANVVEGQEILFSQ
ncbi:MAG: lamin tail domain-containing protein [candidate division Zixibacteria bacterium]|nr:lamin tail domain-containing protein [candidate division Zixibacteria bacterium]